MKEVNSVLLLVGRAASLLLCSVQPSEHNTLVILLCCNFLCARGWHGFDRWQGFVRLMSPAYDQRVPIMTNVFAGYSATLVKKNRQWNYNAGFKIISLTASSTEENSTSAKLLFFDIMMCSICPYWE